MQNTLFSKLYMRGIKMDDAIVRLGQYIKSRRVLKGYSTQELAEILEVSAGFINNIENGKTDTFNLTFMKNLCKILDLPMLSILSNETEEIKGLLSIRHNVTDTLSNNVNDIIEAYLQLAVKFNYDPAKMKVIKEKIIYELNFILNII